MESQAGGEVFCKSWAGLKGNRRRQAVSMDSVVMRKRSLGKIRGYPFVSRFHGFFPLVPA